jgi:biopolymer transport protein ExbD
MKRFLDTRTGSSFKIQITSLVDVFVIMLVFLLKSYSTSTVQITPSKEINLPASTSVADPKEILKLVVAQNGIYVDDKRVIELRDGAIVTADLDQNDPNYIPTLFKALDEQATKTKTIAGVNEAVEFDGQMMMQADRKIPYEVLRKVMYTSTMAGYSNLKIAVTSL